MLLKVTEDYGMVPIEDAGIAYLYKKKVGDILTADVVKPRNYKFLQKAMVLVRVVHDALDEPEPIMHNDELIQPVRDIDDTREHLTILAGEYDVIGLPDGSVKLKARSWAFANMDEDKFESFYSKLIDASLKALPDTWDEEELERVARELIGFV